MQPPEPDEPDQLALIGPRGGLLPRAPRKASTRTPAHTDPVAHVCLDSPLPRLDRPFDYLVPETLDAAVRFGVRVRVTFGRQRVEGWVIGRSAAAEHDGRLQWIEAVVTEDPVVTPEVLSLCRKVADYYLGTLADVLRLAVPPRLPAPSDGPAPEPDALFPVATAPALSPGPGRFVWTCPADQDWASWFAGTLAATAGAQGRGLAVVPDGRDLRRLTAVLAELVPGDTVAVLTAGQPPARRAAAFRAALQGSASVVVGTRSAMFAPLPRPDVMLLWDDGDDSHAERRAPYPHAREVLGMRSTPDGVLIVGGYARTPSAQRWIDSGWARGLGPTRVRARAISPRVTATDDDTTAATPGQRAARLPPQAGAAIRAGLAHGPVLVCVARRGYVPRLTCRSCRAPADCAACGGPLAIPSEAGSPACERCGRIWADWRCPHCDDDGLRAVATGSVRTAEELGRAFPNVPVVVSSGNRITDEVGAAPALVIATPGAEPRAAEGYAAVVVLDVAATLALPGLRAAEQAARRWFNAGALVRRGGPMIVVADPSSAVVQALIRWDPEGFAARELEQRRAADMPPARRALTVTGRRADLDDAVSVLPQDAAVLGPIPAGELERILITATHRAAPAMMAALRNLIVTRSAAGAAALAFRVDPQDLL